MGVSSEVAIKDSIAAHLLKVVFSIYFIIAVSVTLVHMAAEYYNSKDSINQDLIRVHKAFEPGLAQAMWNYNNKQLRSSLIAVLDNPAVIGVKIDTFEDGSFFGGLGTIVDEKGKLVSFDRDGKKPPVEEEGLSSELFWRVFTLKHSIDEKMEAVGKVTLFSNTAIIFQRVKLGFAFIIVNAIIKTAALWIIFLWAGRIYLNRPLAALTTAAEGLNLDELEDVKIDIKVSGKNELKILEGAFNAMIQKLNLARQELHSYMRKLEDQNLRLSETTESLILANERQEMLLETTKGITASYDKFMVMVKTTEAILQEIPLLPSPEVCLIFHETISDGSEGYAFFRMPTEIADEGLSRLKLNLLGEVKHSFSSEFPLDIEEMSQTGKSPGSFLSRKTLNIATWKNELPLGFIQIIGVDRKSYSNEDKKFADTLSQFLSIALEDISITMELEKMVIQRTKELKDEHELYKKTQSKLAHIGEMTSGIVHDFKNPVGTIQGFIQLLQMGAISEEEVSQYLTKIKDESTRIGDMIHELLDFARGTVTLIRRNYSLGEYLEDMKRFLRNYIDEDIEIVLDIQYDGALKFDKDKLRRVIYNLATNAQDAMPDGGEILVKTEQKDNNVEIRISDNGPGIPEEIRDKLFDTFVTHGKKKGSGMGTAIAKTIVEEHGGQISFETETGEGTTFIIRLPVE